MKLAQKCHGIHKSLGRHWYLVVTSQDAGARLPGFESWLYYF